MKINGYSLRSAIVNRSSALELAVSSFHASISKKDAEATLRTMEDIEKYEREISKLQAFQAEYNLTVTVEIKGEEISLAEAVKMIGGLERVAKQWKLFAAQACSGIFLKAAELNPSSIARRSTEADIEASTLRGRMSMANTIEIDFPELDEALVK